MDKAKELTTNPFKYKNKYNKELDLINKIIEKNINVVESERDEKLINEFDKLLNKTKDPIQAQIRGTVLNDLGYVEIAQLFYNKAIELGYVVESKIILEDIYTDDNIEDIEDFVTNKLVNNFIQKEDPSTNDIINLKIKHVTYNTHSVTLSFDDESTMEISYKDINKLFDGDQIIQKGNDYLYGIALINTPELETMENNNVNETVFSNDYYDNLDHMYFRFTNGYKPEDDPSIRENIEEFINTLPEEYNREEVTDYLNMYVKEPISDVTSEPIVAEKYKLGDTYSSNFDYNGMFNYALSINMDTPISSLKKLKKSLVDTNYHGAAKELAVIIDYREKAWDVTFDTFKHYIKKALNEINEAVGTIDLEADIAANLYPSIKDNPNYTVADLEEEILNHGGTLDMVDKVMAYLVNMGINFAIEEEPELEPGEEPYLMESKKSEYDKYFLTKTKEFGVSNISDITHDQWIEIDNGWIAQNENPYQEYFKSKLKEFGVNNISELTNDQWENIDKGWVAQNEALRNVTVKFDNGDEINTNMAAHLTDEEIYNYYAIDKEFNLGSGENDKIAKVKEVIINEAQVQLPTPIGNTYTQVLPLAGDVNPKYNIFDENEKEYVKPDFNIDAVKRMIEADSFLNFSYHNLLSGDFEKDMELIYNTYIKKDDKYMSKLKTYESYSKMLKENILATTKYNTMLEEIINNFNIDLGEDTTDIMFKMAEFIDANKAKFKSYFALLTPDLKEEFRNKFNNTAYAEVAQELLDTDFNISKEDIDNISSMSNKLEISEQLALLLLNIVKSVYNEYQYKMITDDIETNSILFMTIIAVIFKTLQ